MAEPISAAYMHWPHSTSTLSRHSDIPDYIRNIRAEGQLLWLSLVKLPRIWSSVYSSVPKRKYILLMKN